MENIQHFQIFDGVTNTKAAYSAKIDEIVDYMRNNNDNAATINQIRNAEPLNQGKLKQELLAVVWGANFNDNTDRKTENIVRLTGYMCIDIDKIPAEFFDEYRSKLKADAHTALLFTSPSGTGLKVVVKTMAINKGMYTQTYNNMLNYYTNTLGINYIDRSTSDAVRLCFLSHDPDLYYNPQSTPFECVATREGDRHPDVTSNDASLLNRDYTPSEIMAGTITTLPINERLECLTFTTKSKIERLNNELKNIKTMVILEEREFAKLQDEVVNLNQEIAELQRKREELKAENVESKSMISDDIIQLQTNEITKVKDIVTPKKTTTTTTSTDTVHVTNKTMYNYPTDVDFSQIPGKIRKIVIHYED